LSKSSYKFVKTSEKAKAQAKIPIRITNPENNRSVPAFALIDTGADMCTFPLMISMSLGLPFDEKHKSKFGTVGISGVSQDSYVHQVVIEVLDEERNPIRSLNVEISSLKRNDIPPLLGVYQFLDQFHLSIDYRSQSFDLTW